MKQYVDSLRMVLSWAVKSSSNVCVELGAAGRFVVVVVLVEGVILRWQMWNQLVFYLFKKSMFIVLCGITMW